nr:MAG TPA: hypothetical protein [Caudoviricetes sp.]
MGWGCGGRLGLSDVVWGLSPGCLCGHTFFRRLVCSYVGIFPRLGVGKPC